MAHEIDAAEEQTKQDPSTTDGMLRKAKQGVHTSAAALLSRKYPDAHALTIESNAVVHV